MGELAQAYRLLREFKENKIPAGRELTEAELALVGLLAKDLLPTRPLPVVDDTNFVSLIFDLANEDTRWNRALMEALDSFYSRMREGSKEEAIRDLNAFVERCPSSWYCNHAKTEIKNAQ